MSCFKGPILIETKVDMILKTLSNSFRPLKLNYFKNNTLLNLLELIKELQMTKKILKVKEIFILHSRVLLKLSTKKKKSKEKKC